MNTYSITIIGSGNVATQLGKAFYKAGHRISAVYSRQQEHAERLASVLSSIAISSPSELLDNSDIYLIAINDSSLEVVSSLLPQLKGTVVHTAGSIGMQVLDKFPKHGVFYPLLSLNRELEQDLSEMPLCIEANTPATEKLLLRLGATISTKVLVITSEQRLSLHIAAVFANNFTHHLNYLAQDILKRNTTSFELLLPLVKGVGDKILQHGNTPLNLLQTGPAQRGDTAVMEKHSAYLAQKFPELEELYKKLSESIIQHKTKK